MATYLINQLRENSVFRAFKHRSVALIMEQPFSMKCVLLSTCVLQLLVTDVVNYKMMFYLRHLLEIISITEFTNL